MHKRNLYVALTILCLTGIITLQAIVGSITPPARAHNISVDQQRLLESPHLVPASFLLLLYAGLILTGLATLTIAIVRKFRGRAAIAQRQEPKVLPLDETKTSKLFFLSILPLFIVEGAVIAGTASQAASNPIALLLIANGLIELITISLVVTFLSARWLDFRIKKTDLGVIFTIYTATLPLLIAAALAGTLITQKLGITRSINPAITLFLGLKDERLLALLAFEAAILGPVAEELFFRGFIYKFVRTRFSFLPAAIATSLFFALLHRTPQDILPLSVISVSLCYTYERTQNIISPIIFHAFYNSLTLALLFLLKDFIKL